MRTPRFEVFPRADEDFGWRLVAANGLIVAGGEGFTRRADAHRGVRDAVTAVLKAGGMRAFARAGFLARLEVMDADE